MRLVPDIWTNLVAGGRLRASNALGRASPRAASDRLPLSSGEYQAWIHRYDRLTDADRRAIRRHIERFGRKPTISLLLLLQEGRDTALARTGESLRRQLYPHWELICISPYGGLDRPSNSKALHDLLTQEPRFKWVPVAAQAGPSACLDSCVRVATGEYLAVMKPGDAMPEHALYQIALEADRHPGADVIYADHDEIDLRGHRSNPRFKPDWDPDFAMSANYLGRAIVFRAGLLRSLGGFGPQANGDCVYALVRRCAAAGSEVRVRHIPAVLYHAVADSFDDSAADTTINRQPRAALPEPVPRVSIIVPTRDGGERLRRSIGSILTKTAYPGYELLVVDNQSSERGTLEYLRRLGEDRRTRILRYDASFNYSAINNYGVLHATGEFIALVNDDVEVISRDWLLEMVSHAARADVGAVGAKLYFPDGSLQHGGIIVGLGGVARHSHKGAAENAFGYLGCLRAVHSVSAVTGACLVVRKALYNEVGGFDANLPIAFNDVDFCLRLVEAGYRNIWTPFAELYHIESATRGYDDTPSRRRRLAREARYLKSKWQDRLCNDPAYNPNLSLSGDGFSLACPPRTERPWAAIDPA